MLLRITQDLRTITIPLWKEKQLPNYMVFLKISRDKKKISSNVCPYFVSKVSVRIFFHRFLFHIKENLTQSIGT